MKTTTSRFLPALLAALSGLFFTLALTGCTTTMLGSSGSAVSGAGDTCVATSDCQAGLECEHGTCQPHHRGAADGGVARAGDDQGDDDRDGGVAETGDDDGHHDGGDDVGEHHDGGDDNGQDQGEPDAGHDDGSGHGGDDGAGHH